MSIVTPLKSPNNFICAEVLKNIISKDVKIDSFWFLSGQLELSLYNNGYDVTFFTNKFFVWEFWQHLKNNHEVFIGNIKYVHDNLEDRDLVYIKDTWTTFFDDSDLRAALFYLLNRYSTNGIFTRNEIMKTNFSPLNLRQLNLLAPLIENAEFRYHNQEDFCDFIEADNEDNLYLIPATEYKYKVLKNNIIKNKEEVYFNHERIFKLLKNSDKKILAIYKYNQFVEKMHENKILIDRSGQRTNNRNLAEEIVFYNFSLWVR